MTEKKKTTEKKVELTYEKKLEEHIKFLEVEVNKKAAAIDDAKASFNQVVGALNVTKALLAEYNKPKDE